MSLVKCPECGREISDKAKACPQCGNPVLGEPTPPTQPAVQAEPQPPAPSPASSDSARVDLRTRLDTPAPRHERNGLFAFVVLQVLVGGYPLYVGVTTGESLFLAMGLGMLLLAVLGFVRRPWALFSLVGGTGVLATVEVVFAGILGAAPHRTPEATQTMSSAFWMAVGLGVWVGYFWRRRWWFWMAMPRPVPASSPKGGTIHLWAVTLLLAIGVLIIGMAIGWTLYQ